jgi:hypothetical protein
MNINLFRNMFKKDRVLSLNDIVSKIYQYSEENVDPYSYVEGLYVDDNNDTFAILASSGKLKKLSYSISGGELVVNSVTDVVIDFTPVSQSRIMVKRTSDTESVWYGIVASAVLNRNAEIDTTKMFQYLEENYKENSAYLTFQHLPKEPFEFGTVDGVFRYNEFLIGYGRIDTSKALGRAAEKALSSGEYGFSIGFMSNEGKIIDVGGVKIRTFEVAQLIEVSILKESNAANLFTQANYKERFTMASREQALKALTEYLNDEEEAEKLVEQADFKSREIHENGLITRQNQDALGESLEENNEDEGETEMNLELTEETLQVIGRAAGDAVKENNAALLEAFKEVLAPIVTELNALKERQVQADETELNKPLNERTRSLTGKRPTQANAEDTTVKLSISDKLKERMEATRVK